MFTNVSHSFVGLAEGGKDPKLIPGYYAPYYDKALKLIRLFPHFGVSTAEIHENFWPIICLLAQQEHRIVELEKMLTGGVAVDVSSQPDPPPVAVPTTTSNPTAILAPLEVVSPPVPIPKSKKVDKRTKAYKEAQKKQELAEVGV